MDIIWYGKTTLLELKEEKVRLRGVMEMEEKNNSGRISNETYDAYRAVVVRLEKAEQRLLASK